MRRILALLVVLALSLGLCSIPAGSATLQRAPVTGGEVIGVTDTKDGDDGEDIDGGDDDRWGNTEINGGGNGDQGTGSGDDEEEDGLGQTTLLGRMGVLSAELRVLFGFLVMML
ncbi:MAG TPA: hypothetical protein VE960_06970 [bacterium]|nr:hypothetical protein [bacterium]